MFIPLNERILVEYNEPDEVTKTGIFIPEIARQRPLVGKIVEIGKSKDGRELPLSIGDMILHSKGGGSDLKIGDQNYIILKYDDVIAKIT